MPPLYFIFYATYATTSRVHCLTPMSLDYREKRLLGGLGKTGSKAGDNRFGEAAQIDEMMLDQIINRGVI